MTIRENYFNKANNLIERLLDEQPEEENPEVTPEETTPEEGGETEEDTTEAEPEKAKVEPVEVFFSNLNKDTQKVLLDALKESLNATEDDELANQKIIDALAEKPLVTLVSDELVRKLNIDI